MKDNLKNLLLIFSIMLNIVFVGGTSYFSFSSSSIASKPAPSCPFLYQELNLTTEQLNKVEPARDRFHGRLSEIGGDIKTRQLRLVDLLAAPEPDRKGVEDVQQEIKTLQQTMQDTIISHILEQARVFTPEQRIRFFELMKDRIEHSQPGPAWMKPPRDGKTAQR
jgi:Spy/CpxP family protein refolding chaperone